MPSLLSKIKILSINILSILAKKSWWKEIKLSPQKLDFPFPFPTFALFHIKTKVSLNCFVNNFRSKLVSPLPCKYVQLLVLFYFILKAGIFLVLQFVPCSSDICWWCKMKTYVCFIHCLGTVFSWLQTSFFRFNMHFVIFWLLMAFI